MIGASGFQWSTGKVVALCLIVAGLAFYGGSKSKYFTDSKLQPAHTDTATAPLSNVDLSAGLKPEELVEDFTFVLVTDVLEGDVLTLADGTEVNLIGVTCPKSDETDPTRLAVAQEALAFSTGAVLDREVRLEYEPAHLSDNSGRTLAYVYLRDGSLLNAELIKRGYGNAFTHYAYRLSDDFRRYELTAKNRGVGLWEDRESVEAVATSSDESSLEPASSSTTSETPTESQSSNALTRSRSAGVAPQLNRSSSGDESLYNSAPNSTYPTYTSPSYTPPRSIVPRTPPVAENGSYYGEISERTGRPKTVHVEGYYRRDGTYVRGHYRSKPRR